MKLLAMMAILAVLTLSGCETVEGLGKDIQNLGDSIEKKAKKTDS